MSAARLLARRQRRQLDDALAEAAVLKRRLAQLDHDEAAEAVEADRQFAQADAHGLRQMPAYLAAVRARKAGRARDRAALHQALEALQPRILLHHREAEKFETVEAARQDQTRLDRKRREQGVIGDLAMIGFITRRRASAS